MMKMRRNSPLAARSQGVWHKQRGASTLEFAIVIPVLLLVIMGMFELSFDMMMDASVQSAAQIAARKGLTTSTPANGETRADQAKNAVATALKGWIAVPGTTYSITTVSSASYNDAADGTTTSGQGGLGDIVTYSVSLTTPGMTGLLKLFGYSSLTFQRNFIVQNEK